MRLDERRIRRYVSFRFVSFRTCIFFCARLCDDKLKCRDVTVTNQKDKEFFLPKIMKINRAVMLAFYSSLAAEELLRS